MESKPVTWEEAQTRSHTTGINAADLAESWTIPFDVSAEVRVRLVVDTTAPSGQTVDIIAWLIIADSANTA